MQITGYLSLQLTLINKSQERFKDKQVTQTLHAHDVLSHFIFRNKTSFLWNSSCLYLVHVNCHDNLKNISIFLLYKYTRFIWEARILMFFNRHRIDNVTDLLFRMLQTKRQLSLASFSFWKVRILLKRFQNFNSPFIYQIKILM